MVSAIALIALASRPESLPRYRLVDLGVPVDAGYGYVSGRAYLNNSGTVAGNFEGGPHEGKGFVIRNGKLEHLSRLSPRGETQVTGINERGDVCGMAMDRNRNWNVMVWGPKRVRSYGRLGFSMAVPTSMNAHSELVGVGYLPSADSRAFRIDRAGRSKPLPAALAGAEDDLVIDDSGAIYGSINRDPHPMTAGFCLRGSKWSLLKPEVDRITEVGDGTILGEVWVDGETRQGVLWRSGAITRMPVHYGTPAGMNRLGTVVGSTGDFKNSELGRAWILVAGTFTYLDMLVSNLKGWQLTGAYDINDFGVILGEGLHNGRGRLFLLKPVSATKQ